MARLLVRASSNRYVASAPLVTTYPFTIVGRARLTSKGATAQNIAGFFKASGGGGDYATYVAFENRSGEDKIWVQSTDNNNWISSSSLTAPAIATWFNFAGLQSASNSRQLWLNGNYDTANTDARLVADVTQFQIGAYVTTGGSYSDHFDGDIADVAILNIIPTTAQLESFNKGFTPRMIWKPSEIVDSFDFYGNVINEVGRKGNTLTPNGTPAKSAHPRIINPT